MLKIQCKIWSRPMWLRDWRMQWGNLSGNGFCKKRGEGQEQQTGILDSVQGKQRNTKLNRVPESQQLWSGNMVWGRGLGTKTQNGVHFVLLTFKNQPQIGFVTSLNHPGLCIPPCAFVLAWDNLCCSSIYPPSSLLSSTGSQSIWSLSQDAQGKRHPGEDASP